MNEEKFDTIEVEDENGNKKNLTIYFTYHSDNFNKDYVIFYDPEDQDSLLACSFDEDGNLFEIESEEEYKELDEIIDEFQDSNKN